MGETISAISTAHGVGAISIVRVSGKNALQIASKICRVEERFFQPRFAHLLTIYNSSGEKLDRGIVIYFKNPNSFTGEDIVEFQTHGGVVLSKMILKETLFFGARPARGGEFSQRAFLNGKMDMTEVEAVGNLIEAKSEEAVKELSKQLHGELKNLVSKIRSELLNILAHSEVTIDYAEEDLPEDIEESIEQKLSEIEKELKSLSIKSKSRNRIFEGFKISIIGKPNVGKSSFLNMLLNYERAIVSPIEGTTRDSVEEYLTIGTHLVKIVDTAGIRESSDFVEKIGIERSLKAVEESDFVLAIFDSSRKLDGEDTKILEILKKFQNEKSILVILNKSDLEQKIDEIQNFPNILISAKNGNSDEVHSQIETTLNSLNSSSESGTILSSIRQINAVEKTLDAIQESKESLEFGELEIFSFKIEEAIREISSISKPYEYGEMLDEMFGNFCLGK
ncbi:tRNA modification GTPase TrmE [Thiovulum sp. ES]|nr:tRNA modification GTPase TrmE [Thiovulum sp. ES]